MLNHFDGSGVMTVWGSGAEIVSAIVLCFSVILLCIAIGYDVACREIPNEVSYGFVSLWGCVALGCSLQVFWRNLQFTFPYLGGQKGHYGHYQDGHAFITFGSLVDHLGASMIGALIIFGIFFFLWFIGGMGGGDVKLIVSSSLLFTPEFQIRYILNIALAGGFLVFVYYGLSFIAKKRNHLVTCSLESVRKDKDMQKLFSLMSVLNRVWRVERWRLQKKAPLPYGVAIAAGFLVTFLM